MSRTLREALDKPRRTPVDPSPELLEALSASVRRPGSSYTLRPFQARALAEMAAYGGACLKAGVGSGKTLPLRLAPRVFGVVRVIVLIPAGAAEGLARAFDALEHELDCGPRPEIVHYEAVSLDPELLDSRYGDCQLCLADEVHKLKNPDAGVTRRWLAWIERLNIPFVMATGTLAKDGVCDYAHLLAVALGAGCPIPQDYLVLQQLGQAIDRKPRVRIWPKALLDYAGLQASSLDEAVSLARGVWARRLAETPGIVDCDQVSSDAPLEVRLWRVEAPEPVAEAALRLEQDWVSPGGVQYYDPLAVNRDGSGIGCGLYYQWKYPAPEAWAYARSEWGAAVRYGVHKLRRGWDTEGDVRRAVRAGSTPKGIAEAMYTWDAIADSFTPQPEAHWLSDFALEAAVEWMAEGPGLVWVQHTALGYALEKLARVPYYRQKGRDSKKRSILDHPATRPAILSIDSCKASLNLQKFNRNLFLGCAPCDQSIGRTHRPPQDQTVRVDVWRASAFDEKAMASAIQTSRHLTESVETPVVLAHAIVLDRES